MVVATLSNMLSGSNPLTQMKSISNSSQTMRMGDPTMAPNVVYNPTQRLDNQMRSASQVLNYASSKQMAEQGRTDMRGNVIGFSDTLG